MSQREDRFDFMKVFEEAWGVTREAIPRRYYRIFEDRPFKKCDFCQIDLIDDGCRYAVNKYFVEEKPIHEVAIYIKCMRGLRKQYSLASVETTRRIFSGPGVRERLNSAFHAEGNKLMSYPNECRLCGAKRSELSDHYETAVCEGTEIIYYTNPSVICGECTIQTFEALSDETKDIRRRFFEKFFGLPPSGIYNLQPDEANTKLLL